MKKATAIAIRSPHPMQGPAEPWLLGAFLVLFSVAVAAALPAIASSIRTAMADEVNGTQGGVVEHRATVRVRVHFAQAMQANAAGGNDALPSSSVVALVRLDGARPSLHQIDLSARTEERGFSARAPPRT